MIATEPTAAPAGSVERTEEALSWAGLVAAETIRVAETAAIALAALLVCPPLLILLVIVVVPTVALAGLVALVASVFALPVLVVRHFHRHRAGRAHLHVRRLAELGRSRAGTATSRFQRIPARVLAKLSAPRR
jgi:positive regulator of sigma E activity